MSTILASTSQADAASTTTSVFEFNGAALLRTACTNGVGPPTTGCQVTLYLSTDNVTFQAVDTKDFGVAPSVTYIRAFKLSDYVEYLERYGYAGPWAYYKLKFTGNTGAAVTISAFDNDHLEVATIPLVGVTATTGGAVGSWTPPDAGPLLLMQSVVYAKANSGAAASLGIGVAANSVTAAYGIVNNSQMNAAAGTAILGTAGVLLPANSVVTATANANSSPFTGTLYITYFKIP